MTVKKYFDNRGNLTSVGFDSLEEVFAYQNLNNCLTANQSNEYEIDANCRESIQTSEKFKKFVKNINKNEKKF